MWVKFQKYGLIGVANTGIDFIIYSFLVSFMGVMAILAHMMAWAVVVQFSYLMNGFYTFNQNKKQVFRAKLWLKFILSNIFTLAFSSLILYLFLPLWGNYGAKIAAIIAGYMVGFGLSHGVVFKEKI